MCQLLVDSWVTYERLLMYAPYALYLCFLVMINFGFGMGILSIGKTWLIRVYVSIYDVKFCSITSTHVNPMYTTKVHNQRTQTPHPYVYTSVTYMNNTYV